MAEKEKTSALVIYEIPIDKIDPFPNHPFKVVDDGDMEDLVESIRAKGLITPCIVRKMPGERYELISGHRRTYACDKLGFDTIKCEVLDISRDEATILMVESNFQRDRVLPSEKAFAYKMRLDAMKKQISRMKEKEKMGQKYAGQEVAPQVVKASKHMALAYGIDPNEIAKLGTNMSRSANFEVGGAADPVGPRMRSNVMLAAEVNESTTQIKRYIRLTELEPKLLDLVDEGKLGLRTGVELSYLKEMQKAVIECIDINESCPTHAQSIQLRKKYEAGALTEKEVFAIMTQPKPNQRDRISLDKERFGRYIPDGLGKREREDYIEEALKYYERFRERRSRGLER